MTTERKPLKSGWGPNTTASEILTGRDLTGKTAIVTGGYSGVGLETTRALTEAGATVVVPARTLEKASAELAGIPRVQIDSLDLMDPVSIDAFAGRFIGSGRPLDILINNAGIMAPPLRRDARGYESQFATNHLGHFQLTARLWPSLRQAPKARVVSLSSIGHRRGRVNLEDPNFLHRPYDKWEAYGQSKSANSLFAVELDRRGQRHNVRAFAVHPGGILTDLVRNMNDDELAAYGIVRRDGKLIPPKSGFKTVAQGAATSIWCAVSPQLDGKGGVYCEDCDIAPLVPDDAKELDGVRSWAIDPSIALQLWELSELLTVTFSG